MAETDNIERDFKRKVCDQVSIEAEGMDRYVVDLPLTFDDGDRLPVVLKKTDDEGWILTDEGHTLMQLTYDLDESDLQVGTRKEIIDRTLSTSRLRNQQGELILRVEDQRFGDSLYTFIQALIKIDDIRYLSRERVRSTFIEDVQKFVDRSIPAARRTRRWHDLEKDPQGNYEVDYRIENGGKPLFVFALDSETKIRDATISLHNLERWGLSFESVGIFEDQETINRKVLARFLDICGKSFSNLPVAEERFQKTFPNYFKDRDAVPS